MIDIKQINIAIKVAGEEYHKANGTKIADNIHSLVDVNNTVFQEVLQLSEQYLNNHVSDPQILEESLTWLRAHMKIDEQTLKKELVNKYLKVSNQLG